MGFQNTEELKLFIGNIESIVLHTKYFLCDDTEIAIAVSTNTKMALVHILSSFLHCSVIKYFLNEMATLHLCMINCLSVPKILFLIKILSIDLIES